MAEYEITDFQAPELIDCPVEVSLTSTPQDLEAGVAKFEITYVDWGWLLLLMAQSLDNGEVQS